MDLTASPVPVVRTLRLSGDRQVALTSEIGRGSMANVFMGAIRGAVGGHRMVAVKVFDHLPQEGRERILGAIARAMSAATCVCDPRVVQVYDYNLSGNAPFVVMELVDGGTLESLILGFERQGRQLPHDLAILIGIKAAEGIHAALASRLPGGGAAGLVHGNVAPRDVLVSWSGEVKVKGFGLALSPLAFSGAHGHEGLARLAAIAPEVACGQAPNAQSDVFSLGILLRHMLLGQRFSPHTSTAEALHLLRAGVVHTSLNERGLLPPLRAILSRATHPDPRKRHAHTGEVAAELRGVAEFLRIPDVPAYVARAVADAFPPGRESVARLTDPSEPQMADLFNLGDEADLAWAADLVEIPGPPSGPDPSEMRPPLQSGVSYRSLESAPTLVTASNWFDD